MKSPIYMHVCTHLYMGVYICSDTGRYEGPNIFSSVGICGNTGMYEVTTICFSVDMYIGLCILVAIQACMKSPLYASL
jgi:hypothetical protein